MRILFIAISGLFLGLIFLRLPTWLKIFTNFEQEGDFVGDCNIYGNGYDHISKLVGGSIKANYHAYNEKGLLVPDRDCRKSHGKLYVLRKGDLFMWPLVTSDEPARDIPVIDPKSQESETFSLSSYITQKTIRKLNQISQSPRAFHVANVLNPSDLVNILQASQTKKSIIATDLDLTRPQKRTMKFLDTRLADLLRLPEILVVDAPPFEIVNKTSKSVDVSSKESNDLMNQHLHRSYYVTLIIFLNDAVGGDVAFPIDNQQACGSTQTVQPKAGDGKFFFFFFSFFLFFFFFYFPKK